jgi:hypothetical protein
MFIKDLNSAQEAWEALKAHYNPSGFTSQFLVCRDFFNTRLEDFESMEAYITKIKLLLEELKRNKIELPKQVTISWVLNSLDDEYSRFIQNITQSLRQDPEAYTLESLFTSLLDESRGRLNKPSEKALYIKGKKGAGNSICPHCKLRGHTRESCYFLFPEKAPQSWRIKKREKEKKNNLKNLSREKREKLQEKLLAALASIESPEDSNRSPEEETINTAIVEEPNILDNPEIIDFSNLSFEAMEPMETEVNNIYTPYIYIQL